MKGEFYKMEFDAWDEGTIELTLEQEAAYLRLCHQMYRRRGPVPNSERLLCSIWRCHQNKARVLLRELIAAGKISTTPDGHLTNTRVTREVDARETLGTRRSHAGQTGGIRSGDSRRNALKSHVTDEAIASAPSKQNPPIREEERREEETHSRRVAKATPPTNDKFEEFWREYPRRDGENPKAPARKVFEALVKSGTDPTVILAGIRCAKTAHRDRIGTPYIPQAVKWLRDRRFDDYAGQNGQLPLANAPAEPSVPDEHFERAIVNYGKGVPWPNGFGSPPGYAGCKAPQHLLEKHGYGRRQ